MRYMLMVCQDESTVGDAEEMRTNSEGFAWSEEMDRRGPSSARSRPGRATASRADPRPG